ncbi:MAG TPA: nucleoside 2-deoxyribosyltransferase [Candidatus Limnocylindrales bacterium]|nr:nucleoside 2-deoxyribosyltransferase [Candidatus Limnocylindrales bacterium]
MKIFFAGSIRAGRGDSAIYQSIIEMLSKYGKVLTEHVGDKKMTIKGDAGPTKKTHDRDMKYLVETDIVLAEVTTPSLGVGYEIAKAEEMGKSILCLFRPIKGRSISAMISGSDKLVLKKYQTVRDVEIIFEQYCRESGIVLK